MCPLLDEYGLVEDLVRTRGFPIGMVWKCLQLRTTLGVCLELVRMWGGLTEWDDRPDEIQAEDPIRVFKETMDLGQGSHGWGWYVVYTTWLQDMHGEDRACQVLRTLEIRHPESIPPLGPLSRWTTS